MYTQAIALVLALPFVAQLASANTCTRTYTVQDGDICDSISAANNVSTYQLAVVNYGVIDSYCDNLDVGKNYCLGWEGEDCSTTYVVQAGDDCEMIAARAQINTTILYENNPQINAGCTNIYIKEVLCTAGTVQVPPAPNGNVVVTPTAATPAVTPMTSFTPTTSFSSTASSSSTTTVTPTPTPTDNSDDNSDDDSDLPWCD